MPKGVKVSKTSVAKPAEKALFPNDVPELSQAQVVHTILDSGILKPAEIEQVAKEKYNRTISKGNINQAKMAWKKKQGTAPKAPAAKPAPTAPTKTTTAGRSASSSDVITATLDLVRAVGVDKAESILKALGNGGRADS